MKVLLRLLTHPAVGLLLRAYLAWVFLAAAWPKLLCPIGFSVSVAAYRVAPDGLIPLAAVTLPWVELVAGIGLLIGYRVRAFGLITAGLNVFFIVLIVLALQQGVTLKSCGCEVPGFSEEFGWGTVLRDVGFLLAALYVVLFDRAGYSLDGWIGRRRAI